MVNSFVEYRIWPPKDGCNSAQLHECRMLPGPQHRAIRYTESKMPSRLLAFVLACVVIGAPLGREVCGVFCTDQATRSIGPAAPDAHHHSSAVASHASHDHHRPDDPSAPAGVAGLRSVSHECARLEAVVIGLRDLSWGSSVADGVTVARITAIPVRAVLSSDLDGRHGPPVPSRSTSPLRI